MRIIIYHCCYQKMIYNGLLKRKKFSFFFYFLFLFFFSTICIFVHFLEMGASFFSHLHGRRALFRQWPYRLCPSSWSASSSISLSSAPAKAEAEEAAPRSLRSPRAAGADGRDGGRGYCAALITVTENRKGGGGSNEGRRGLKKVTRKIKNERKEQDDEVTIFQRNVVPI